MQRESFRREPEMADRSALARAQRPRLGGAQAAPSVLLFDRCPPRGFGACPRRWRSFERRYWRIAGVVTRFAGPSELAGARRSVAPSENHRAGSAVCCSSRPTTERHQSILRFAAPTRRRASPAPACAGDASRRISSCSGARMKLRDCRISPGITVRFLRSDHLGAAALQLEHVGVSSRPRRCAAL